MLLWYLLKLLFTNPAGFAIAIVVLIFPLLVSITVHEWSHGMVAYLFGDPTPKKQGRLTLNPFAHLDPVGTLMLLIVGIGWAKPVMIDTDNIQGRTQQMLVALAGPASNFILAFLFAFVVYLVNYFYPTGLVASLNPLLHILIRINIILAVFNMMPIPPLDGSNVVKWILPEKIGETYYSRIAPYGIFILLLLLFTVGFGFVYNASIIIESYIFKMIRLILSPILGI